jgi:lipopolysaccharide export system protein LptA
MRKGSRTPTMAVCAIAALLALAGGADAQVKKQANPFQGFSSDNGKPVDVKSETLEVYQNEQKAIFIGNVVATQGESILRTPHLVVFYENNNQPDSGNAADANAAKPAAGAAAPAAGSSPAPAPAPAAGGTSQDTGQASSIKRLEASGGVVVTANDQKATGSDGVFDMESNTAVLTGGVVLTQGQNVIRGSKLTVDLKTGVARVVGGTTGLFVPSQNNQSSAPKPK